MLTCPSAKSTKVKTGCITCKIRRVKCDEGKPSCMRCQSTGRKCDGYTATKIIRKVPEKAQPAPSFLVPRMIAPKYPGNEQEQRGFSFFHNNTAPLFAGYFDSSFWEYLVLQVSSSEPCVRHAIVALGSIHESYENNGLSDVDASLENQNSSFALQQYTKSVSHLNKHLSRDSPPSIVVVLICCVLFICLEALQGNFESLIQHVLNGSKIFDNWQQITNRGSSNPAQEDFSPIFTRFRVQVRSLLDARIQQVELGEPKKIPTPIVFSSLQEARNCLYLHMDDVLDFIQAAEMHSHIGYSDHEVADEASAARAVEARRKSFLFSSTRSPSELAYVFEKKKSKETSLFRWLLAFDKFLSQSSTKMNTRDLMASILLKIHYICIFILLKTCHTQLESAFDEHRADFEKIVALCHTLIETSTLHDHKYGLWYDMGILAPLYFAAVRCRDPLIRQKAVQLLKLRGEQEGSRDVKGTLTIAERVIALEEENLPTIKDAKDIPEFARIIVLKVTFNMAKRAVVLSCYNSNASLGRRPKYRREYIKW